MYEVYKNGELILRAEDEKMIAMFFFGVTWGHGNTDTIIDYDVVKDGMAVVKTFIVNKYFPKR